MKRNVAAIGLVAASMGMIVVSDSGRDLMDGEPKPPKLKPRPIIRELTTDSAGINRRTGKPHENSKANARRRRQMERNP